MPQQGFYGQPGVMPQPGMMPQQGFYGQPGVMPQQGMMPQPGVMPQPGMNPYLAGTVPGPAVSGPAVSGPAVSGHRTSSGRSRRRTSSSKQSGTPMVLFGVGLVAILTIAIGSYSYNTKSARAYRLYVKAQSCVNARNFDDGRQWMELALELDKKDEYVRYRSEIDVKQKKYEKAQRHQAAREEDDTSFYSSEEF